MSKLEWLKPGGVVGTVLSFVGALALTLHSVTEEVEVGNVSGVAYLDDGTLAVNAEVYIEKYVAGPDLSGMVTRRTVTDAQGRFRFGRVPAGYSSVRAYAPGYSATMSLVVSNESPELNLTLMWAGDELMMATNQPVFTPDERPKLVINGMTRRKDVAINVYTFTDEQIFEKRDVYQLTRDIVYNRRLSLDGEALQAVETITHKLTSRDIQGRYAETVELPALKEGVYIVSAESDRVVRHQWVNVSRLGLVTKASPGGVMGFVVDIETGEPKEGVAVSVVGEDGRVELGRTDADGVVRDMDASPESGNCVMVATDGESRAFSMYNRWSDSDDELAAMHMQTDRPIYRPGDEVQYKGFVRVPGPGGYRLPDYRSVEVAILDPDGTEIKSETLSLSASGGFDGSFKTVPEMTGSYQIGVVIDGQRFTEWVPILAYRKPEFKLTVTPLKRYYVVGERAEFKVKAEFFTGEPVVGAELSGWFQRSDIWEWSPFEDEEYEWWASEEGDYAYGGEYLDEVKSRTDENGEAVFSIATTAREEPDEYDWSQPNDLKYTLSVSGSDVSGRYFDGEGSVEVVRGDIDLSVAFGEYVVAPGSSVQVLVRGKMYGSGEPAAGAKVSVEFGRSVWSRDKASDRKQGTRSVTLDERGEAMFSLSPTDTGDFYVGAEVKDAAGRTIEARDYVWVYESGARFASPAPSMQVILDKKTYKVGESATAVVRTDKPGGYALVTIEARDVLWSRVVKLDGEATTVEVSVTDDVRPNARIQVCYIRDKAYASSGRSLVVDMGRDTLDVRVVSDVKEALPGDTVSYEVTTRDAEGRPVAADVCLSVVDEGVYSIREDRTDPLKSFYPNRWSAVGTYYSFPEVYLDGEDKSGAESEVRADFRDTALWAPSVETGEDGVATVLVKLPDNLTSWRTTATAVADDARAGKGTANVVARKPLMVRMSLPLFMVQDERQSVGVSVRNETDRDTDVEVRLGASGLDVVGAAVQKASVKARSAARLAWEVRADSPGEAKVTVLAASDRGDTDGLEQKFPVHTNGPTLESYAAGDTTTSAKFEMTVDGKALTGELEVRVTPSILASLVESLDSLVDYPYGCVEQTMSRFMPAVVVLQFLREAGLQRPDLEAKIAEVAAQSLARLGSMQHGDGGFGWWVHDQGDPEMTAYVIEGLYHAEKAGMEVNAHMRDRAIEWAKNYANQSMLTSFDRHRHARLAYALSLHGVPATLWSRLLPDLNDINRNEGALSYTVLALASPVGAATKNDKEYRQAAYEALLRLATETDISLSWSDNYWNEPTAVALQAVMTMESDGVRAGKAIRYLMQERRGRSWTSTRDTAQVVIGATKYMRGTKELRPDFTATVTVNGALAGVYRFGPGDLSKSGVATVPVSNLTMGRNEITVEVQGTGRAHYSSRLRQGLHDANPRPTDSGHGLKITREYYRMEARRLEDGTLRLVPSQRPVTSARQGEVLHCVLTVSSKSPREHVMVQDPALSNAHAIEFGVGYDWEWGYWWSDHTFLDDHTALFVWYLGAGSQTLEYTVRAEAVGTSIALPATVSLMYQPDVRATTGTSRLEVRP